MRIAGTSPDPTALSTVAISAKSSTLPLTVV